MSWNYDDRIQHPDWVIDGEKSVHTVMELAAAIREGR